MLSEVKEIVQVAQSLKLLKTRLELIFDFTRPYAITYDSHKIKIPQLTLYHFIGNRNWQSPDCLYAASLLSQKLKDPETQNRNKWILDNHLTDK